MASKNQKSPDDSTISLDAKNLIKNSRKNNKNDKFIDNIGAQQQMQQQKRRQSNEPEQGKHRKNEQHFTHSAPATTTTTTTSTGTAAHTHQTSTFATKSRSMDNNRYQKRINNGDNSLPVFVHDMDDPSSGTS